MPSVMEAAINRAEASSSLSPLTLLNRALDRIHISRGMLKIRISVMELGRFTAREAPARQPEPFLSILLDYPPRPRGTQCSIRRSFHVDYFAQAPSQCHHCRRS